MLDLRISMLGELSDTTTQIEWNVGLVRTYSLLQDPSGHYIFPAS